MVTGQFDAVVLAGGRGSRLGGIDKATLTLGGDRLVDRVASAAHDVGAQAVIVVGPEHTRVAGGIVVREDPPFSGPLAAVAAALPTVSAKRTLLLACDLVNPDLVCERIAAAFSAESEGIDGVVLRDDGDGRMQWLASMWKTAALRRSLSRLAGDVSNRPLRDLFRGLEFVTVDVDAALAFDIDRPEDLARARDEAAPTDRRHD